MTVTCRSVTSGKASMESVLKASTPAMTKTPASRNTKSGWLRAKDARRRIIESFHRGDAEARRLRGVEPENAGELRGSRARGDDQESFHRGDAETRRFRGEDKCGERRGGSERGETQSEA